MLPPALAGGLVAGALVAGTASAAPAPTVTWGTPGQAASITSTFYASTMINSAGTRILTVWADASSRLHSRVGVISGGSITWGDDTTLPGTAAADVSVAYAADGTAAFAAWSVNGFSSDIEYSYATIDDSVVTWRPIGTFSGRESPQVAISDDGSRIAARYRGNNPWPVMLNIGSVQAGSISWATPIDVSGGDSVAGIQHLAMSNDGSTVVLAYSTNTPTLRMAAFSVSGSGPPTVAGGQRVAASTGSLATQYTDIALSGDGQRVAVAWASSSSPNTLRTRFGRITGNVITFADAASNGPTVSSYAPQLSVDDSGARAALTWQDPAYRVIAQTANVDDSIPTWDDTVTLLSTYGSWRTRPIVTMSRAGTSAVVLALTDGATPDSIQAYATSLDAQGDAWSAGQAIATGGSNQNNRSVALSADGSVSAAGWAAMDSVPNLIFARVGILSGILPPPVITGIAPDTGPTSGGTGIAISGAGFRTGATVTVGGAACPISAIIATSITCTTPAGATGAVSVTVTNPDQQAATVVGGFTYADPAPPPAPAPPTPPSAPRAVTAAAGDQHATVAWLPPESHGSFGVSHYRVTSQPAGGSCLTSTTSCTVAGLSNGTAYTFTVAALSGAGWSSESEPSNVIVPRAVPAPPSVALVITGMRTSRAIEIAGTSTGLEMGALVTPWARRAGGIAQEGREVLVSADGTFTWARRVSGSKPWTVYVTSSGVKSNALVLR